MVTFKKFDNQQVYQLVAKNATELTLDVGDLISYVRSTNTVEKITTLSAAETAMETKELYIVAQSDAVTYKTGRPYKTYKLTEGVTIPSGNEEHIVVAYRVETLENIEGLEA